MEPLLFIVFLYIFAMLAFARMALRRWKRWQRERSLWQWSSAVTGRSVQMLVADFGAPFDVMEGEDRTLYEWRFPPARGFPKAPGLLIVYVTVDSGGTIVLTSWRTLGT